MSDSILPNIENERRGPLPTIQTRKTAGAPPALTGTASSTDEFVKWLVASSKADLPAARAALEQATDKDAVATNLTQQFGALRDSDITRSTLILNALGYLRVAGGEALFTSLVNEPLPAVTQRLVSGTQKLRKLERYQTAAVYGLAFMHSSSADTLLKSLMSNHPSRQIRIEAVRSFLFHNPTTDRAELSAILRASEAHLTDRFENRNGDSGTTFDDRLNAYLAKHPQL